MRAIAESSAYAKRYRQPSTRGRDSDPVAALESLCRRLGPDIGRAGAVPFEHHIRGPTGEPLEVTFLAAVDQEVMRKRVAEAVRVDVIDSGELGPELHPVPRAVG